MDTLEGASFRVGTIRRMGKTAEQVVDLLESADGALELEALSAELGSSRPRDLRRRVVSRLEAAGVVECDGRTVGLTDDWLSALDHQRKRDGEFAVACRDRDRYEEQRKKYRAYLEERAIEGRNTAQEEHPIASAPGPDAMVILAREILEGLERGRGRGVDRAPG